MFRIGQKFEQSRVKQMLLDSNSYNLQAGRYQTPPEDLLTDEPVLISFQLLRFEEVFQTLMVADGHALKTSWL